MKTNREITMRWASAVFDHGRITIPKGTRVSTKEANGPMDKEKSYFIDEFGFLGNDTMARHDAEHYGIRVSAADCEV